MNERAAHRAAIIAAILAIGLLIAWRLTRGEQSAGEPRAGEQRAGEAESVLDAGVAALEGGSDRDGAAPRVKPRPAGEHAAPVAASTPWANEQPPPDYVGEPTDGGRPLPTKAPRADYDVVGEEELDDRRRETIDFLNGEMDELERAASRADEGGDSTLASSLRERRARLQARRDTLSALLER